MPLSAADYLVGVVTTLLVLGVLGWGAWRLRCRVVPEWDGALARTAEATIVVSALVLTGQLLGAAGLLRPAWSLLLLVGVGAAMALLGAPSPPSRGHRSPDRAGRFGIVAAAVAGAAVAAQWASHTAVALNGGMTQFDTLWYHGPFSARFLQRADLGDLAGVGYSAARFFPLDIELLHTYAAMPFGTDLASPLINLALLSLAGVAAWAVGQPHSMGSTALLGGLVVLSFPALVATQAGQASTDVAAAAFLVASAAMLLAGGLRPGPATLAGLAAGLALGSKLTVVAVVGVLTVGVLVVAVRARRPAAGGWCLGVAAVAGGWFVRNWLLADNPVPWFDIEVGPLRLQSSVIEFGEPLIETVTDLSTWRNSYLPDVAQSMGRAWPVMLVLFVGAAVLALRTRAERKPCRQPSAGTDLSAGVQRRGVEAILGAAVLIGVVAHVLMPMTGGFGFRLNLRYLHPTLMIAGSLVALVVAGASDRIRRITVGVLGALVVVNLTSPHEARVPMWPREAALVGLGAAVVILAALGLVVWRRARPTPSRSWPIVAVATLVVVTIAAAGWPVQQRYHRSRYRTTDLELIELYRPFQDVRNARVAVVSTPEVYPMFGPDLSNEVTHLTDADRRADLPACRAWRLVLADRFDYVAVVPFAFSAADMEVEELSADPAATVLVRNDRGVVYRVGGRLATEACRGQQGP